LLPLVLAICLSKSVIVSARYRFFVIMYLLFTFAIPLS
jgi:hypothetical protein